MLSAETGAEQDDAAGHLAETRPFAEIAVRDRVDSPQKPDTQSRYNSLPNGTGRTFWCYGASLNSLPSKEPLGLAGRGRQLPEFKDLLEEQIPRLRRYAIALTRKPDEADDLVQETLLRALAKAHLWQPGTDLRAWLFTMLHNQRVNAVRRAIRAGNSVNLEDVSGSIVATTDPTASRTLFELDRAMGQISEEHRQVILLIG